MQTLTPYRFFYKYAGYSYNPKTQTGVQGKVECARRLAKAEAQGREAGLSFYWLVDDPQGSREWLKVSPAWATWSCICQNAEGKSLASLWSIDFGRDGDPWSDPYHHVVEAELAMEALASPRPEDRDAD